MSDELRIALVTEGFTDVEVLRAAFAALLPERRLAITTFQPEGSAVFGTTAGALGEGWGGVYRWCRQIVEIDGSLSHASLFEQHDLLIIQIDADVADQRYQQAHILDPNLTDLPCAEPCPPPSAATDALRRVVLGWMNEPRLPARCVFCTPSKAMETWVIAALFPENRMVKRADWECRADPEAQLRAQPKSKRAAGKKKGAVLRKSVADYRGRRDDIAAAWPRVRQRLTEAERFSRDLIDAVR